MMEDGHDHHGLLGIIVSRSILIGYYSLYPLCRAAGYLNQIKQAGQKRAWKGINSGQDGSSRCILSAFPMAKKI